MQSIIVIVGPTGVGKTQLSIALAHELDAEIINADSMQVYKGLDIGTAKIKEDEKEGIVHHLLDIVDVNDNYSVFDYQRDCRKIIEDITNRGKRVIIVGGTGLYIKAALFDYHFQEGTLQEDFHNLSNAEILNLIKQHHGNSDIHINNRQRLIRSLNKCLNNEKYTKEGNKPLYPLKIIGLSMERSLLYERINQRVEKMIENGLIEEVRYFYDNNVRSKPLISGIGYKEIYEYFDGNLTKEEAISQIKQNSRHYAKRQFTFFNNQMNVKWFTIDDNNFTKTIDIIYNELKK